ncbi:MAG: DUF3849 domain-containing protein [Oscillospiraceae bacterium]|nr:DUF3849 domain-containing protein [Oscillospiraceae bacterium]
MYPYSFAKAQERSEASIYHMSRRKNEQCAKAIDAEISNSYFKTNHYNLDLAALKVLYDFGFERVSAVLAHNFREHDYDGRYSAANKEWARAIDVPEQAFKHTYLNAHPILIEDFTNYARKFYEQVGAAAHALPGAAEHGTVIADYEVVRSIAFDDERGFAIGQHPAAACPFVCWQFTSENGVRDFYWGTYCDTEKEASDNFCARVMTHMYGEAVQEISQAAVSAPTPPPSVLGKIREARVAPESPSSPAPYRNREEPEL